MIFPKKKLLNSFTDASFSATKNHNFIRSMLLAQSTRDVSFYEAANLPVMNFSHICFTYVIANSTNHGLNCGQVGV